MITLLTDFGTADYFVGAVKGVISCVNPDAHVVDITHEIPEFNVAAGAFTLLAAYRSFPSNTIHVAIVDPGVGSKRRPILVITNDYFFVGPDNGLFSYIYEREPNCRVLHLSNEAYFRDPVSSTFHGRDIFAPIAGALSNGVSPDSLGTEINDYMKLEPLATRVSDDESIEARIIHIDRFGNCITNLTREVLTDELISRGVTLKIGDYSITTFRDHFAETNATRDDIFCVWGSAGFLEIAAHCSSAAKALNVELDHAVIVTGCESVTCHT